MRVPVQLMAAATAGHMVLTPNAELAAALLDAVERVVAAGIHTPDLGGTARTADVTEAVIRSYATEERDAAGGRGA